MDRSFRTRRLSPIPAVRVLFPALLLFFSASAEATHPAGGQGSRAPAVPPAETQRVVQWEGSGISPEAQKVLEERPELKDQLPPDLKRKLEERPPETGRAKPEPEQAPDQAILPPYDWRDSVYVGGLFKSRLREAEIRALSHFGHEVFAPRPGGLTLLQSMPVAPGYVIGPGDEVVARLWGRMEGTYRMVVDRDGKIFFPKIGSLYVAGKTFEELKTFLRGKVGNIAEVSSDVSLGQMKGIRVSVVGEVRAPGWYNVSSLHTVLQVLYLAGGVRDIGSLRRIELRRGGKIVETIDLYEFLLSGDSRADTRLLHGDKIFVPVVGSIVALAGQVRRPAIYELKDEKTLPDLVRMAGGFAPTAYTQRVQVERLEGHLAKTVLDVNAGELGKGAPPFEIADGDIVRVLPIVLSDVNAVTLKGNVVRPGKYELKEGMTVGDLFPDERAFLPDTYFDYALLSRRIPPEMRTEVIPVNLREIVLHRNRDADVPLKPYDTLEVFHLSAFRDNPRVTISGEVRWPATFDLKKGARVSDLVKIAGDLTKEAYLPQGEIVRVDEKRNFHTVYFDLGKAMAGDEEENVVLRDEDEVRVHSIREGKYKKTVSVRGEVHDPGDYLLTEGMKLSDLIFKAGGLKESAYGREGELVRREIAPGGEVVKTTTMVISPERAVAGEEKRDIPLKDRDVLVIRQIPEWKEKIQVLLSGEIQFPGTYAVVKGERLSSLLSRAGGFTPDAYLRGAQFTRLSVQAVQQEAIDKLIDDLEVEVAQKAQEVSGALDREDVEANKLLLEARRSLIAQLKKARAKGRVVIRLAEPDRLKGTAADILLEDGDKLEVPKKMNVVNVVGRVYNPTGVVYDPANDRVSHYLETVGGPTESADREHIFLVKMDGSVVTQENVGGGFLSGGLLSARVEPGDSIVVPEKLIRTRLMKDVKDITQILYQIAVTAGVLIVAF